MGVIYKFNNGQGATLCNKCRTIISTGKKVDRLYCDSCQKGVDEVKAYYEKIEKEVHFNRGNLNK